MRNGIVHGYSGVDMSIVWVTIYEDLSVLKLEVENAEKTMREKFINNKPPKNNILIDNLDEKTRNILELMRRNKI